MGKVIAGMTMSLDGFIQDRNGSARKLSPDFEELLEAPSFKEMTANTGAVIMGRNVYEMADPFLWANDDYEFQVPVFVLTHTPPARYPQGNGKLSFTFVTDGVESAVSQAKKAAGDKMVQIIGGASTIQQCLNSGLCDELLIDMMPVLLGEGLSLFENLDTDKLKLERTKVAETTSIRTSMTFRITRTI
ncbi:dihydrofolate reductase family protein [Cohnella candidum]|uniref:Dihydrofolate reductase n=1 Tax=Cohnella candidum TaxID=2674991 RepID=A0A3G3JTD5_9BACL|nr:dihydrofolate reductase family protein [Cohnella candidum]AYQ71147.1 dihydrofolate reductase [Cohnella candidum]